MEGEGQEEEEEEEEEPEEEPEEEEEEEEEEQEREDKSVQKGRRRSMTWGRGFITSGRLMQGLYVGLKVFLLFFYLMFAQCVVFTIPYCKKNQFPYLAEKVKSVAFVRLPEGTKK